jgi:hypothetical protein
LALNRPKTWDLHQNKEGLFFEEEAFSSKYFGEVS